MQSFPGNLQKHISGEADEILPGLGHTADWHNPVKVTSRGTFFGAPWHTVITVATTTDNL
jgi:hypothetical protein